MVSMHRLGLMAKTQSDGVCFLKIHIPARRPRKKLHVCINGEHVGC